MILHFETLSPNRIELLHQLVVENNKKAESAKRFDATARIVKSKWDIHNNWYCFKVQIGHSSRQLLNQLIDASGECKES